MYKLFAREFSRALYCTSLLKKQVKISKQEKNTEKIQCFFKF